MDKKHYFVDESGIDTRSDIFIVVVCCIDSDRIQDVRFQLEKIENSTGKGRRKWMKTQDKQRIAYIEKLSTLLYHCKLYVEEHVKPVSSFDFATAGTIQKAIGAQNEKHIAYIYGDGFSKKTARFTARLLHNAGFSTRKVKGIRKEESDSCMRLSDAIAGLVRRQHDGKTEFQKLYDALLKKGICVKL